MTEVTEEIRTKTVLLQQLEEINGKIKETEKFILQAITETEELKNRCFPDSYIEAYNQWVEDLRTDLGELLNYKELIEIILRL